jgi:hypothetical protein
MGTRNLTKVIDKDGTVKVAQYGQWDGYPSGQGINALIHAYNYRQIEKGLDKVRWATQEELDKINSDVNNWTTDFSQVFPTLSRDTCADILGYVAWSVGEIILVDNSEFENDELFCEAVYTIDFVQKRFISTYDGHTLYHELEDLPEPKEYLAEWATELDPGTAG